MEPGARSFSWVHKGAWFPGRSSLGHRKELTEQGWPVNIAWTTLGSPLCRGFLLSVMGHHPHRPTLPSVKRGIPQPEPKHCIVEA